MFQSTQPVDVSGHRSQVSKLSFDTLAYSSLYFQSTEIVDVLERHQQKNGRPRAPNPTTFTALHGQSMVMAENNDGSGDDPPRERRARRRGRDQPVPPTQIGHYGPVWKDCLEEAKIECRAVHALSNPWPKLKIDAVSLTDSLTTVVMEWDQRGVRVEPGNHLLRSLYCNNFGL